MRCQLANCILISLRQKQLAGDGSPLDDTSSIPWRLERKLSIALQGWRDGSVVRESLVENPGSVPRPHRVARKCFYHSCSRGYSTFFWPQWAPCMHMEHIHTGKQNTQMHKIKYINLKRKKSIANEESYLSKVREI